MDRIVEFMPGLATGLLVAVCATAVVHDVLYRKIPNWLTLGALLIATSLRSFGGWEPVGWGLVSAGLAFAFGLPFFLAGGLGGGDVKLMAGLATFLDPPALIPGLLVMAFTGGAIAVIAAVRKRATRQVFSNVYALVLSTVTLGRRSLFSVWQTEGHEGAPGGSGPGVVTNPYGVAIAAGALAGWFL